MAQFPKVYNGTLNGNNSLTEHNIHTAPGTGGDTSGQGLAIWQHFGTEDDNSAQGFGVIDIYTFSEGAGAGQVAYALVIAKNIGDTGSTVLFDSSNAVIIDEGENYSAGSSGFSIVTDMAGATVDGIQRIIPHSSFAGASNIDSYASAAFGEGENLIVITAGEGRGGTSGESINISFVSDSVGSNPGFQLTAGTDNIIFKVEPGVTTFAQLQNLINSTSAFNSTGRLIRSDNTITGNSQSGALLTGGLYGVTVSGSVGSATIPSSMIGGSTNLSLQTVDGLTSGAGYIEPLGYFPIRQQTQALNGDNIAPNISVEITSGNQTETHSAQTPIQTLNFQYIPIYTPAQVAGQSVDNTGGIPHYCAFLVKFDSASTAISVTSSDLVTLNFNLSNADDITIYLTGDVVSNSVIGLDHATEGPAVTGGTELENIVTRPPALFDGDVNLNESTGGDSLDTVSEHIRMKYYPLFLVKAYEENTNDEVLEYIRIREGSGGAATLHYTPYQFAQLTNVVDNNWDQVESARTRFHWHIPTVPSSQVSVHTVLLETVKLTTDASADDVIDNNGGVVWSGLSNMADTSNTNIQSIPVGEEHYLTLVRRFFNSIYVTQHDFFHPDDQVSATYTSSGEGFAPVGNDNFRPFVIRCDFKYYPYYSTADNNSGLDSAFQFITTGTYFPWTPSQEVGVRFRKHMVNTFSGPIVRNDTYKAPMAGNFEFASIRTNLTIPDLNNLAGPGIDIWSDDASSEQTAKSVINANGSGTDQDGGSIIQPVTSQGNAMVRNAIDNHDNISAIDYFMEWQFNMLEPTPSNNFIGGTGAANLFCNRVDWKSGIMQDSANNLIGEFILAGNNSGCFTRYKQYNNPSGGQANEEGDFSTRMSFGEASNFDDVAGDQYPLGAKARKMWFELRFEPKDHVQYSIFQANHDSNQGMDQFGRNVYVGDLTVTGGYNAVHSVNGDGAVKDALLAGDEYATLTFTGMAWPEAPDICLVTSNNSGASGAYYNSTPYNGHVGGASIELVDHTDGTTMNWYDAALYGAAGDANESHDPGGTNALLSTLDMTPVLTSGQANTTLDFDDMKKKMLNGSRVVRSKGFFHGNSNAITYELCPRFNITRKNDGSHVGMHKEWQWFVSATTKLNSSLNRYEAYIPLNFLAKGDHAVRIIDMHLTYHCGDYTGSSNTWAYGELANNGSDNAKSMAPMKPFQGFANYNANVQAANSCADFITQTGGLDVTDTAFIWSITHGPGNSETFSDLDGSTVPNKSPYAFVKNGGGITGQEGIYCDFQLQSHVPNSDKYEVTGGHGNGTDIYGDKAHFIKEGTGGFTGKGYLVPGTYSDGATSPSLSLFETGVTSPAVGLPHAFFAIDKEQTDSAGLVSAHFYNRVRIRYMIDHKQDMIYLNNQEFGQNQTNYGLIIENEHPVYEAYVLIKVEFEGVSGSLAVFDAEGDSAPDQSVIDFGTINV